MSRDAFSIALLFVLTTGAAWGQDVQFRHLSVDDGLSQSAVYDIIEDRQGYLWFGTQDGLNRYTGHGFDVFNHDPADSTSISHGWITSILEADNGDIWVGTHGGGLNRLERSTGIFHRYRHNESDPLSLPDDIVTDLTFDGEGRLWISTYSGIARLDSINHFTVFTSSNETGLTKDRILTIATDAAGTVWAGSDLGGVHRFDGGQQFESVDLPGGQYGEEATIILTLFPDKEGMWVGTAGAGVYLIDENDGVDHYLPRGSDPGMRRVLTIARDGEGVMRFGTDGAGLGRIDPHDGSLSFETADPANPNSISRNLVNALSLDSKGSLWMGTTGGGIDYSVPFSHYHTASRPPIRNNHVTGLLEDESGGIWVGTDGGGVERFGPGSAYQVYRTPQITFDRILRLDPGPNGQIWISTGGGLNLLNPASGRVRSWQHEDNNPASLLDDRVFGVSGSGPDSVWIATWGGLHRMSLATGNMRRIRYDEENDASLSNNRIISVLEDSQGRLWAGTLGGGLNLKMPGITGFIRFAHDPQDERSLTGDIIADIHEASDGTIWVTTADGLNRFDETTSSFTRYTVDDGLPNNTVYGMEEDADGRLWMSTNRGLGVMESDGSIHTFYVEDGLQSNEFNQGAFTVGASGAMMFGGINGFNRFYPERVLSSSDPIASLSMLTTAERAWPVSALGTLDHVLLEPGYGALDVEFTANDWRNPETVAFEIRLDGAEENWQFRTAGQRFASYSRLKGGDYTLQIRTRSSDGVWSERVYELDITVVPPFSETLWFRLLMLIGSVAALGAVGYGWHLSRIAIIQRKQDEQREVHRRLMDSRENERLRMAQDLHDGAVQDLYGVRFRIQSTKDTETDDMVQDVISELRRICSELRPPVLAPFGLERAIRAHADILAERQEAPAVILDLDEDGQSIPEDVRLALYRVYQESMANVVKHAGARSVWITLRMQDPVVELEIRDDGKGFSPPASWIELGRKDHFGLLGLSERVDALGAQLVVDSAPGKGTRIRVRVENIHFAEKDNG